MVINKVACALLATTVAGSIALFPANASAAEYKTLESCDGLEDCAIVTNTAELDEAFVDQKSTVIIGTSFELTADVRTTADVSIFLNDYTITTDGWSIINDEDSGDLTIYAGENGKIVEVGGMYAPLYVYSNTTLKSGTIEAAWQGVFVYYDTGVFTMDGGIISSAEYGVTVSNGGKFVLNDGEVTAVGWGVAAFKDAEIVMNGGTVTATSDDGIGVSGNGSLSGNNDGTNAKLTLNAGVINSGDLGVYAPQAGGVTVLGEDLEINAAECGVEVRAGTLNVGGAKIDVDPETAYVFNPNGSGSTASGVAIAVAQHTTKQSIVVNVTGGDFTAPVTFAEANPQHNEEEDVEKVELSITGGVFNATNGDPIVASEDVEKFITGGIYNKMPELQYIADNYTAYETDDGDWVIDPVPSATIPDSMYIRVGETVKVDMNISPEHYVAGVVDGKVSYDSSSGEITGVEAGNTEVTISWRDVDCTVVSFPVYVYTVVLGESEDVKDSEIATIQEIAVGEIADCLANGTSGNIYVTENGEFWDVDGLREAVVSGKTVGTALTILPIDMNDTELVDTELEIFVGELGEDDEVVMIYSIDVSVYASDVDGDNVHTYGRLTKVDGGVTLRLGIPADLPGTPEGFRREFFVVRSHRGIADEVPTLTKLPVTVEGDEAVFESDLFSDFVLAYTDIEEQDEDEPGEGESGDVEPGEGESGEEPDEEEPAGEESDNETLGEKESTMGDNEDNDGVSAPGTGVTTRESGSAVSNAMTFAIAGAVLLVIIKAYFGMKHER